LVVNVVVGCVVVAFINFVVVVAINALVVNIVVGCVAAVINFVVIFLFLSPCRSVSQSH
jgi:hypothetical protein